MITSQFKQLLYSKTMDTALVAAAECAEVGALVDERGSFNDYTRDISKCCGCLNPSKSQDKYFPYCSAKLD